MEDNLKGRINRDALFSSETEDYRMPMEPDADDDVLLRMRTAKGMYIMWRIKPRWR